MKKRIILVMLIFAFIASQIQIFAQGKSHRVTVTGTVKTTMEESVDDAFLFVDGLQTNIKTNRKGNYKIKITRETNTISVYSDSRGSEEINYTGQDRIDFVLSGSFNAKISMEQKTKELVNVGYGKVEREKVTTSVGSVNEDRIRKQQFSNIFS
ncbi:MAG: hypothetical protein JXB19_03765 [Bacteroidales bacterium]|nr:hypothetical protein [Bacteroidales bacterium]